MSAISHAPFDTTGVPRGRTAAPPAIVFVLSRIGLVTAGILAHYFKHAVLGCVVVAAVITPTTDFGNMLVIAGPMIALYGVGIAVAWVFGRTRDTRPSTDTQRTRRHVR